MTQAIAPEISVVLPGFNESATVAEAVEAHHRELKKVFRSFEIVVIDDASTDDTLAKAHAVGRRFPEVRVHANERNLGQAASLRVGFRIARGAAVLHNAFDMPFAPSDIHIVKRALDNGADVVVVERASREAYGIGRKIISNANVLLLRALFRCAVRDYNFVQAYRRSVVDTIEPVSTATGSVTPELIVRATRAGFNVVAVPAPYHTRRVGRSTVGLKEITSSLVQTVGLSLVFRRSADADRRKREVAVRKARVQDAIEQRAS
jgi:glycosyltransferase involved in cell wall biosynthesis